MRGATRYLRSHPQVLVLLIVCLVLGLGAFLLVVISLAGTNGSENGDPTGSTILLLNAFGLI